MRFHNREEWLACGSPLPTKGKYVEPYDPKYVGIVSRLIASGRSLKDTCSIIGVSKDTLYKWKRDHIELKRAILHAKEHVRAELIRSGIERAVGYSYEEQEISGKGVVSEDGEVTLVPAEPVRVKKIKKHVPGDSRLLMFLVGGLDRQLGHDDWTVKQQVEKTETIKLDASEINKQIDRLTSGGARPVKQIDVVVTNPTVVDAEFENQPDEAPQ